MAATWEELEQKYSGGATTAPSASDPWSELEAKYGAPSAPKTAQSSASTPNMPAPEDSGLSGAIKQGIGNLVAGGVRGAGSIGATILAPLDAAARKLNGGKPVEVRVPGTDISVQVLGNERRNAMDEGLRTMGADPDAIMFKGGKLGAEIAGTSGVGGAIAKTLAAVPGVATVAPNLLNAIQSGGFVTGNPAATTIGGKVLDMGTRMLGGSINGAASAGLVNPEDAKAGAAIGGALPVATKTIGATGKAIGRALAGPEISPEVKALADRAGQLGIDIPADRLTNSKPLNALAAGLNYVPFSGRAATETKMQSQLNRALSRTFGQDSDNVTMALRQAEGALGGEFDRVLQSNTVKVDNQFLSDLAAADARATKELGSDGQKVIKNQIDEILAKAQNGEIDGQAAYNIKKTLDRIGKRSTPEAYYALDLKKDLMGALNRSLGPQDAAGFASTRQQYGNMLSLQKLAQNGAEGDVSIARIANMKNINNPQMQELADISAQFLKSREGQHGAAQRALAGLGASWLGGVPGLVGTAVGGRVANTALNSSIVRNGLLGQPTFNVPQGLLGEFYRAAPLLGVNGD